MPKSQPPKPHAVDEEKREDRRWPAFVFASGDPRAEMVQRALDFDGPVASNTALSGLRQFEALRGGDTGERILRYLTIRSEQPAPPVPPARGKLSEEALDEHLHRHPDKRKADGALLFSVNARVRALKNEQDITIDRTTLQKRLQKRRGSPSS